MRFPSRVMARSLLPIILLFFGACYRYVPSSGRTPAVGTDVELELTDAGIVDLARHMGPNVAAVRGRVQSVDADTFHVAVGSVTQRRGDEVLWSGERVAVPRTDIARVKVRRVSATRTALVGVAVAAGVFAIRSLIAEIVGSGDKGPTEPPPPGIY